MRALAFCSFLVCLVSMFASCSHGGISKEAEDMKEPEAKYLSRGFAPLPKEITDAVSAGPMSAEDVLPFEEAHKLAEPGYMAVENGYVLLDDGTAYVAVRTDFPGVTGEMVYWWFWWQAQKDIRYRIWCPGDHYSTAVEDMEKMADESLFFRERCINNTQYPVEDVGSGVEKLAIRFVPPETFGFDPSAFEKQGVEAVMCAVVGSKRLGITVDHTCMVHLFRKKDGGLELRSRFWLGRKLPYLLRRIFISEKTARGLYFHCSKEYNHLASLLPELYREFAAAQGHDKS